MTDDGLRDYRLKELEEDLKQQREELKLLKSAISQMEIDAINRERNRLKAGIGAMGSVLLFLGGVIWAYRGAIFK